MQLHGPSRNGEAQSDATARPIAIRFNPVESFEDTRELLLGNTRSAVADLDDSTGPLPVDRNAQRGIGRRVPDGISQDILHGAAYQFGVSRNHNPFFDIRFDA